MAAYCAAVGLPFIPQALTWEPGERPEWRRSARWHSDVSASSGFASRERRCAHTVETSDELGRFAAHHLPFYEQLHAQRLDVAAWEDERGADRSAGTTRRVRRRARAASDPPRGPRPGPSSWARRAAMQGDSLFSLFLPFPPPRATRVLAPGWRHVRFRQDVSRRDPYGGTCHDSRCFSHRVGRVRPAANLSFYRAIGLDIPAAADSEPHVEVTLTEGFRILFDPESTIKSFDPEWTPTPRGLAAHGAGLRVRRSRRGRRHLRGDDRRGFDGHLEPWDVLGTALRDVARPGRQRCRSVRCAPDELRCRLPGERAPRGRSGPGRRS